MAHRPAGPDAEHPARLLNMLFFTQPIYCNLGRPDVAPAVYVYGRHRVLLSVYQQVKSRPTGKLLNAGPACVPFKPSGRTSSLHPRNFSIPKYHALRTLHML